MRPDFRTDSSWTSSVRSKFAQRLSAVAVGGEISNFGWAPRILYGRQPAYRHGGGFYITGQQRGFKGTIVNKSGFRGIRTRAND